MMAVERGASVNTISAYRRDLDGASVILGGKLSGALRVNIEKLVSAWSDLASSTLARKTSALRQYFGYLVDEGIIVEDPSIALPKPTARRSLPKIMERAEVDRIFTVLEEKASAENAKPKDLRLLALVELLYGSGLRASELVSLPYAAIAADKPLLVIKG